jgi:ubiquinone/menaquinone biosynthesis C-methylase UbiE
MGDERFPRVLDVGCATGFYLKWAFDRGHGRRLLAGVDLSPVMLSEAAARLRPAREAGVDVKLREASATALPFPDGSFDALICNGVAKYLDDETFSSFLLEAARVLRSGGRVAVADFGRPVVPQSVIMPPARLGIPVDYLRPAHTLCEALVNQGFEDVAPVGLKRVRRIPLTYEGAVATRS